MFAARRERLLEQIRSESLDALLVTNPVNVSYLTGFTGDASCLVLAPKRALMVSDGRFTEQLTQECPGLETFIRSPVQPLGEAATATIVKLGIQTIGFESNHLSVAEFTSMHGRARAVSWKPGSDRVERLRMIKDSGEVEQIRRAIAAAEQAFAMFRALLTAGDTEKDLVDRLEFLVRRAGAKETAFPSIVAVGARAALPHAPPTGKRVEEAPLLLIDWGASGPFYKSDLTRVLLPHKNSPFTCTAGPGGKQPAPNCDLDKIKDIYQIVLQAQSAAIAAVRPGVPAKEVDAAARNIIGQAGYGEYFTHSIGHGVGLLIHEAPFMRANTEEILKAGMVVTVEPGIYVPGFAGVRIEDDLLVTPDGCEVLTSVPKTIDAALQIL